MKAHWMSLGLVLFEAATLSFSASADAYGTQQSYQLSLPGSGWSFTVFDAFPNDAMSVVDGHALRGKILAATDRTLYLQNNFGSSVWLAVAGTPEFMDPSFLEISPRGTRVALGIGYLKPLYVFAPEVLSVESPPLLGAEGKGLVLDVNYYDATWLDERYLFINAGSFVGSEVYALDTERLNPGLSPIAIVGGIPGASAGITFDSSGNLVTGIGYGVATGQLKIWTAAEVRAALEGDTLDYESSGHLLAEGVLSAASLGFDSEGNLLVGGGDVFGASGDYGYAALLRREVIERVLDGGPPLDRTVNSEFDEIAPDPCKNDDSVRARYVQGLDMLVVTANLTSSPPDCAEVDWSGTGSTAGPQVQLYFSESALDSDGDGVPDGVDNAYLTPNPDQLDTNGDGFGDVVDFDFDESGRVDAADLSLLLDRFGARRGDAEFVARYDLDGSGVIDLRDGARLLERWGTRAPWY